MKRLLFALLVMSILCLSVSFCGCGNSNSSQDESAVANISNESVEENDGSDESENIAQSLTDLLGIQEFPKEKISHDVMDDGNYYLRVQSVKGMETSIREFAQKGEDAYSNLTTKDGFQWFYSNGTATFSFDDEEKIYEVHDLNPLSVQLFSDKKTGEGEQTFFGTECNYVIYSLNETYSVIHFYRKTDGSWLGFQYMKGNDFEDANIILIASDDYPSHAVFQIPEDYVYYFEKGENRVSMNWDDE